jgi:hypothetical protein
MAKKTRIRISTSAAGRGPVSGAGAPNRTTKKTRSASFTQPKVDVNRGPQPDTHAAAWWETTVSLEELASERLSIPTIGRCTVSDVRSLNAKCYALLRDLSAYERELRDCLLVLHEHRARVEEILRERGGPENVGDLLTEVQAWLAREGDAH